jgi:hypothetical protein
MTHQRPLEDNAVEGHRLLRDLGLAATTGPIGKQTENVNGAGSKVDVLAL